jgi:large subunit ribosomal protein L25
MEQIAITATKRTVNGKSVSKLRKTGTLPAVLYGHKVETQQIQLNERDFAKVLKTAGESTIVNLVVDGQTFPVLIHDVHNHYLTEKPIHVDFFAVNMTEKLKVKVPIHFVGESMAVKSLGGTLTKNLSEVEVECLPADLPHQIEVDISVLATFDDMIRLGDLKLGSKVELVGNPQETVANVTPPRSEEEMKSLDEAVTEDVTAVEGVIKPEETAAAAEGEAKPEKAEKAE